MRKIHDLPDQFLMSDVHTIKLPKRHRAWDLADS
jgi:hypothetical protein